ncbi:hypothetical protein PENTCL1PPCAC_11927, partial [Pristionchus entomophagus]
STILLSQISALTRNRTTKSDMVEPDQTVLLQKICDDPKLITMMERNGIQGMAMVERPCRLSRIEVSTACPILQTFDINIMRNFMISRKYTDSRSLKGINLVLLKLFDQDLIEGFCTRRFSKSLKYSSHSEITMKIIDTVKALSLHRLVPLFYCTTP